MSSSSRISFQHFPPVDIISIGEAMLELSCEGDMRFAKTFSKAFGGDSFNTVVAAQRLGSKTAYVTRLGNDPFAFSLKETLLEEGVDTSAVRAVPGQTGMYLVAVNPDGGREFYYYRKHSAASTLSWDDIPVEQIRHAKVVFATGVTLALSESSRKAVHRAFQIAREYNVVTAFDLNYRPSLWESDSKALDAFNEILPLVDVVLPSAPDDTSLLIGMGRPEQVLDYFTVKDVKLIVVKAGADGCYLRYKRETQHVPAMAIHPVDTTGAGDAFNGGFLHGLATGQSLVDCARLGNMTAGLKIINRGTIAGLPYKDAVYNRVFGNTVASRS